MTKDSTVRYTHVNPSYACACLVSKRTGTIIKGDYEHVYTHIQSQDYRIRPQMTRPECEEKKVSDDPRIQ